MYSPPGGIQVLFGEEHDGQGLRDMPVSNGQPQFQEPFVSVQHHHQLLKVTCQIKLSAQRKAKLATRWRMETPECGLKQIKLHTSTYYLYGRYTY